jgi:hypothetical protein
MKKFVAFSMGALMALGFSACSSDDDLNATPQDEGQLSYIYVQIEGADDALTRADSDPQLTVGSPEERAVKDIKFYFFNSSGAFITKGSVWKTVNDWQDNDTGSADNIERYKQAVVSVPHYSDAKKPTMMITVVNPPSDLAISEGTSISDVFDKMLTDYSTTSDNTKYYIMTTSSYLSEDENGKASTTEPYYYTTDLTNVTFSKTVAEAMNSTPVEVYVERLAVKATTSFSEDVYSALDGIYQSRDNVIFKLGDYNLDGGLTEDKVTLYAKFLGWHLNGTAKSGYYSKHISSEWNNSSASLAFDWNDPARHRSYWCMSKDYISIAVTDGTFPQRYAEKDAQTGYNRDFTCNYFSAEETNGKDFGTENPQYCNEYTQSKAALSTTNVHIPGASSHVLLLAQLTDHDGNSLGYNIVKYSGDYYKEDALKEQFISRAGLSKVNDGNGNLLTKDDVEFINDETEWNGHVKLELKSSDKVWVKEDGTALATDAAGCKTIIDGEFTTVQNKQVMIRYKNGLMYYYSMITHLNPNEKDAGGTSYNEGYYGMVRNHIYNVTIEGFMKKKYSSDGTPEDDPDGKPVLPGGPDPNDPPIDPGHGIEDENEPIIPNVEEDSNYYINTKINILSWRLVKQNVKL